MKRIQIKVLICLFLAQALSARGLKIGFVMHYLAVTGVEGSTYDYADFNEEILGNTSYMIFVPEPHGAALYAPVSEQVRHKITHRFGDRYYECTSREVMDELIEKESIDILYMQRCSGFERFISKKCKLVVHAAFLGVPLQGDVYAVISPWMSNQYFNTMPCVPYIVRKLPDTPENLRDELGIPENARVFGRHGGEYGFDIEFAKEAIVETALSDPHTYFVFMNTNSFCNLPNVIFLPPTPDLEYKAKFINTCDAMIHARARGETFGLACAEFSRRNKPVITWLGSPERSHIDILGDKGIYYRDKHALLLIFEKFQRDVTKNWDAYSKDYNAEAVMEKFDKVFIQPLSGL